MEENTSLFTPEDPRVPSAGAANPAPSGEPPRPWEVVETYRPRDPREVVETYRQPEPKEVVETYSRPLPWLPQKKPAVILPPIQPSRRERRKRRRGLWIGLGCFALLTVLGLTIGWLSRRAPAHSRDDWEPHYFYDSEDEPGKGKPVTIPTWPFGQGASLLVQRDHGETMTAQDIYRTLNPAVVSVMADLDDDRTMSVGTGVIFTADGYVLTNYHVVEGGAQCSVMLDTGRSYEALYVAGNADSDLAVLKVEADNLPTAPFGDSDLLTVGDTVYAIGNPLGMELRGTFTDGIVSATDRDVWVESRTMTLIQTNAALNSGNSGGPLINQYGQVVGINTIKMTSDYSNVEGLGFAIPSASMERLVNDLLTYGEIQPEPVLGVTVSRASEELEPDLWGIRVETVTGGSAADRAGVKEGDYIVSAAGNPVLSSQDLLRARRQCHVGDRLTLTLWREGTIKEVTLLLLEST